MRELDTLVTELDRQDSVAEVRSGAVDGVVKINIDFGENDSLTSEVINILARYDVTVSKVPGRWNYYACRP